MYLCQGFKLGKDFMLFSQLYTDPNIIQNLIFSAKKGRIPHAQLFVGHEGGEALSVALAYAQFLNCLKPSENDSCGKCSSCIKFSHLTHPDLHFVFPVIKTPSNSKPFSADFLDKWRNFVLNSNFHSFDLWLKTLNAENSQAYIYAHEAENIVSNLSYKPYQGKFKILIIWLPEKMNIYAANKLLKIIEEPPSQTVFILVSHNPQQILPTILSRTQIIHIPKPSAETLEKALKTKFPTVNQELISQAAYAADGNYFKAVDYLQQLINNKQNSFFELFVNFMRIAYAANPIKMIEFSESLAELGREQQKQFLDYSLNMLHKSHRFVLNIPNSLKIIPQEYNFLQNFSKFLSTSKISTLSNDFSQAFNDILHNGNPKLIFLDLIFKSSKILKKKEK